ncbi:uncharacterized protein ACNS7B_002299 [Menidia menidia]
MRTSGVSMRVPLFALLIVATSGAPFKGSKDQSSGGSNVAVNSGSYRRRPASVSYGGSPVAVLPVAPALSQSLVASPSFSSSFAQGQVVAQAPSFSQATFQADPRLGGPSIIVPAQAVVQASGVPQLIQSGPFVSLSSAPVATYASAPVATYASAPVATYASAPVATYASAPVATYASAPVATYASAPVATYASAPVATYASAPVATYVPVGVGYNTDSSEFGGSPSGMEETAWAVAPQDFSGLDASSNNQALDLGDVLPASTLSETGPALQSGETSSVVKEAELGNYQQQTEEFGYPDDLQVPGPGLPTVLVPQFGVGGVRGSPYPNFDYRLLYGQYPPGTYSTFSQQNEKGKDYSQEIHYLKEHVSDSDGSGQQKKFFPGAQ